MLNRRVQDREKEEQNEKEEMGKGRAICLSPVTNVHSALISEVFDARPQHLLVCKGRKFSFGIGGGAGGGHSHSAAVAK